MPLWAHTMKKFRCGRNFFAFVPRRKPRLRGTPPQGIGHEPSLAVGKNPATFLFLPVAGNALHACRSRWQPHRRKCGMCRPGLDIAPVFLLTRRTSHIGLALFRRLRVFYCSFGQLCCSAQCSSSSGSVSCTSVRRSSTARRSPSTCCTAPPLRRTPCHQPLRDGAHQPHFRPEPPARRRIPSDTRHLRRMHRRRQPPPPPMAAPRPPGPAAPTTMKTHELHLLHPTIRFAGPKPGAACRHPAGTCGPNRTQQTTGTNETHAKPRNTESDKTHGLRSAWRHEKETGPRKGPFPHLSSRQDQSSNFAERNSRFRRAMCAIETDFGHCD